MKETDFNLVGSVKLFDSISDKKTIKGDAIFKKGKKQEEYSDFIHVV
jgi:hypothetical protein